MVVKSHNSRQSFNKARINYNPNDISYGVSVLATVAKVLFSGIIVVAASEIAKQSTIIGALIVSLPITSILALTYLYLDTGDTTQVAD